MNKVKKFIKSHKKEIKIAAAVVGYGVGCAALGCVIHDISIARKGYVTTKGPIANLLRNAYVNAPMSEVYCAYTTDLNETTTFDELFEAAKEININLADKKITHLIAIGPKACT